MITYLKGILTKSSPSFAVIDVGGMGYKVLIPANTFPFLPAIGEQILLHTSFVIRENFQALYGFHTEELRDFFEEVTTISGIGPKTGVALIGHLSLDDLYRSIQDNDLSRICKVPGIGKKTAERLVIELRDKCGKFMGSNSPSDFAITLNSDKGTQTIRDAMNALINLGYTQAIAQKAIKKSLKSLPETIDLATLITDALNHV